MGVKERCADWAIGVAKHGGSWWMPVVLLVVAAFNSFTGGMLGVTGVLQAALFPMITMSRPRTFFIAPVMLALGALMSAVTYVELMKAGGADALLEKSGVAGSQWLHRGQTLAQDYGAPGLFLLSFTPAPTAVTVVVGMLAKMDDTIVLVSVIGGRFLQLTLAAVVLRSATQNATAEEFLREQFYGGKADGGKKEE